MYLNLYKSTRKGKGKKGNLCFYKIWNYIPTVEGEANKPTNPLVLSERIFREYYYDSLQTRERREKEECRNNNKRENITAAGCEQLLKCWYSAVARSGTDCEKLMVKLGWGPKIVYSGWVTVHNLLQTLITATFNL